MAFLTLSSSSCSRPGLLNALPPLHQSHAFDSSHLRNLYLPNSYKTLAPISVSFSICCRAAKQQSSSVKKRSAPKKRGSSKRVDVVDDEDREFDATDGSSNANSQLYRPSPLPNPPAGFVVDSQGRVLMASSKRIVTIVDSMNNFPLECVIRRVFRSSQGEECMLLCPVDTPVQILKSTNADGWAAVSDEEVEALLPAASYSLAKIHMHLVVSGFCYTARGGFCYSEEDIFEFGTGSSMILIAGNGLFVIQDDDGQDVDGLPTEGVEITCFNQDGTHYMIYTPSDPLLFVAVKDLLEDPAIVSAIDEETEFNALVEEEATLLESLLGKR